jgi:endoglucanase
MRILLSVLLLSLVTACGGGGKKDADSSATSFTTSVGKVYAPDGSPLQLRGINMFGFNTAILIPQYLDKMSWKVQIQQVKDLGFNAVRLPFVPETLYSTLTIGGTLDTYVDPVLNSDIIGKTPLEFLDLWMAEADRQGLYVVMDFHSISKGTLDPLWHVEDAAIYAEEGTAPTYNFEPYTTDDWIRDLVFVATRYASNPHLVGVDLYNEPHDTARWGPGDDALYQVQNDWKLAAEAASSAVLAANPNLLIFVQGIYLNHDGTEDSTLPINYGENLQAESYRPLDIPENKLVLFPHTYGPDALEGSSKSSFDAADFPDNLASGWETLFGRFQPVAPIVLGRTVIVGEFGGFYGTGPTGNQDKVWQDALVDYLIAKDMRSAFYWCYTPNSAGTGGILDDDLNVRTDKIAMLHRLFGI